jgi:hypothetical protein
MGEERGAVCVGLGGIAQRHEDRSGSRVHRGRGIRINAILGRTGCRKHVFSLKDPRRW